MQAVLDMAAHRHRTCRERGHQAVFPGGLGAVHDTVKCNGAVRTLGFGRLYGEVKNGKQEVQDWSLRELQQSEDGKRRCSVTEHLPGILKAIGAAEALAPHPEFGAETCAKHELTTVIPLGECSLLRGKRADITVLAPGEVAVQSPGGCATVWAYKETPRSSRQGPLPVAHMGLKNSLNKSVVKKIWKILEVTPGEEASVHVGICFPVDPAQFDHPWNHPALGLVNRETCESLVQAWGEGCVLGWSDKVARTFGRIDLRFIIGQMFWKRGVPPSNIYTTPYYDAIPNPIEPLWYNTRGPYGRDVRNLVLVQYRAR